MTRFVAYAARLAAAAVALTAPSAALAAVIDPAGDFLATYTGPQNGDLDLLSAYARIDGENVFLSATVNGTVGATSGAFYAWGVNRGAGTEGALQATMPQVGVGVLHDAVVLLRPGGLSQVVLVIPMVPPSFTNLSAGAVTFSGNTISGLIPFSLLPTRGFEADDYTYTAWTRSAPGSNAFIGDFAPDGSPFRAAVPEPSTWAVMILGFGLAGAALRRRYSATSTASTLPPSFSMRRAPPRIPGRA